MATRKIKELCGNLWCDVDFAEYTHDSISEESAAFKQVMLQGITLTLHAKNGVPRPVKIYLVGSELRCEYLDALALFSKKLHVLSTDEVKFIVLGKETRNLHHSVSIAVKNAQEDLFFSIVTNNQTIDLEAHSKDERDAICKGMILSLAKPE